MRLKLLISYVGTGYSGWQIQEKPNPPPTVQGALEAALLQIAGQHVRVHGSGPVSYTHLDVYKRQVQQNNARRGGFRPAWTFRHF